MHWRRYFRNKTHDERFLWRAVASILVGGLLVGFGVQFIPTRLALRSAVAELTASSLYGDQQTVARAIEGLLRNATDGRGFDELLAGLAVLRPEDLRVGAGMDLESRLQSVITTVSPQSVRDQIAASPLPEAQRRLLLMYWESLLVHQPIEPLRQLGEESSPTPPRFVNLAIGHVWEDSGDLWQAALAYEREGSLPDAEESRLLAAQIYSQLRDMEALGRLSDDALYRDALPMRARMQIAAGRRDWWQLARMIPQAEWQNLQWAPVMLALFTGVGWAVILMQMAKVDAADGARWWLMMSAIFAGCASVLVTHWMIYWQEIDWKLIEADDDLIGGLRYFILGVGLREEFSKLLLFLPFVPWLVRRRNDLESLAVAGSVGLGFAMFENEQYFSASFGQATIGRFLTANFFHIASTGVIGLAVVRATRYPQDRLFEALTVFGVVSITHGVYDALIVVTPLRDYSMGSSLLYILLSYQFFHELREARSHRLETFSLTATFLGITSLLVSVTFVFMCLQFSWFIALSRLVPEVLSVALMVYMFLREMPNSLVSR